MVDKTDKPAGKLTLFQLHSLRDEALNNRLSLAGLAGGYCYKCLKYISSSDYYSPAGNTVICKSCNQPTLLGAGRLTDDELKQMQSYWFSPPRVGDGKS